MSPEISTHSGLRRPDIYVGVVHGMEHVERLRELLTKAVEKACDSNMGIVFSGGIDSTIVAILASEFSNVTAYSCGIPGSHDMEYANGARNLGFEIKAIEFTPKQIENSLTSIVSTIGTNPVKVSVAVPFHFASRPAGEDGLTTMLCGQGADELFGGYNRYLEPLPYYAKAEGMMKEDTENIPTEQLNNDIAICRENGIELRAPFLDEEFKNYVMEIPIESKIHEIKNSGEFTCIDEVGDRKFIRKYVLRLLAKELGVPGPILNRRKKAAQYGSGSWKTIQRLARGGGFKEEAGKAGRNDYTKLFLESLRPQPRAPL